MNKLLRKFSILFAIGITILVIACSSGKKSVAQINDILDLADKAIAIGDTATVETLYAQLDTADMLPSQMCRVAIGYAHLSEQCFNQSHMANAAQFFKAARQCCPDSVSAFASQLDYADVAAFSMVRELADALDPQTMRIPSEYESEELEEYQETTAADSI